MSVLVVFPLCSTFVIKKFANKKKDKPKEICAKIRNTNELNDKKKSAEYKINVN